MLTTDQTRDLLRPFAVQLGDAQATRLLAYLELLKKWNRAVNLTAIRDERDCVTRHFGESLFLATQVRLEGTLLDVGSGAGFPGLALKLAVPELRVILLEPTAKKRAFLKEVGRVCEMDRVEVRAERLEELNAAVRADAATLRAVRFGGSMIPKLLGHLEAEGILCVWTTSTKEAVLRHGSVRWVSKIPIPSSDRRELWIGKKPMPAAQEA